MGEKEHLTTPYNRGAESFREGKTIDDCPEYISPDDTNEWLRGFRAAAAEHAGAVLDQDRRSTEYYVKLVLAELERARHKFPAIRSPHEGFAILKEEVDELWQAVKYQYDDAQRRTGMREEAIQVAAMALRFLTDLL